MFQRVLHARIHSVLCTLDSDMEPITILPTPKNRWDLIKVTQCRKFVHCKKRLAIFPSPVGMSLTKFSLAGKTLIIPGQEEFG
jgi:hypothetical protein